LCPNDRKVFLVDIAILGDSRLPLKVLEKQTCYTDLKIKIEKLWNVKCIMVLIIAGAFGYIGPKEQKSSETREITYPVTLQVHI